MLKNTLFVDMIINKYKYLIIKYNIKINIYH